jgi:hypothetical protein
MAKFEPFSGRYSGPQRVAQDPIETILFHSTVAGSRFMV